ncbi:MAG: hypothetical protein NTZ90_18235 [Proteobacteria bacterium]|nr:hypothetical protein [Pseudomonadota bacterium]
MGLSSRFVGLGSLSVLFKVVFTLGLSGAVFYAHAQVEEKRAFDRSLVDIPVAAPAGVPSLNQESIDLALVLFSIDVPLGAEHPVFDPELNDRGLTSRGAFMERAHVTIGPAAFTSWALLGSTLAHELEVHCQQNFLTIYVMDFLGMDGTGAAERQAYVHELSNAKRFATNAVDIAMIADTVQFYYPERPTLGASQRNFRSWLSATLLISSKRLL